MPADRTSLGEVLLAYSMRKPSDDKTTRRYRAIRRHGFAINDGRLESGMRSIGVPIRNRYGDVMASIAVAANASNVTLDQLRGEFLTPLKEAAKTLSTVQ